MAQEKKWSESASQGPASPMVQYTAFIRAVVGGRKDKWVDGMLEKLLENPEALKMVVDRASQSSDWNVAFFSNLKLYLDSHEELRGSKLQEEMGKRICNESVKEVVKEVAKQTKIHMGSKEDLGELSTPLKEISENLNVAAMTSFIIQHTVIAQRGKHQVVCKELTEEQFQKNLASLSQSLSKADILALDWAKEAIQRAHIVNKKGVPEVIDFCLPEYQELVLCLAFQINQQKLMKALYDDSQSIEIAKASFLYNAVGRVSPSIEANQSPSVYFSPKLTVDYHRLHDAVRSAKTRVVELQGVFSQSPRIEYSPSSLHSPVSSVSFSVSSPRPSFSDDSPSRNNSVSSSFLDDSPLSKRSSRSPASFDGLSSPSFRSSVSSSINIRR